MTQQFKRPRTICQFPGCNQDGSIPGLKKHAGSKHPGWTPTFENCEFFEQDQLPETSATKVKAARASQPRESTSAPSVIIPKLSAQRPAASRVEESGGFRLGQPVVVNKKGSPLTGLSGVIQDFPAEGRVTVLVRREGKPAMAPIYGLENIRPQAKS